MCYRFLKKTQTSRHIRNANTRQQSNAETFESCNCIFEACRSPEGDTTHGYHCCTQTGDAVTSTAACLLSHYILIDSKEFTLLQNYAYYTDSRRKTLQHGAARVAAKAMRDRCDAQRLCASSSQLSKGLNCPRLVRRCLAVSIVEVVYASILLLSLGVFFLISLNSQEECFGLDKWVVSGQSGSVLISNSTQLDCRNFRPEPTDRDSASCERSELRLDVQRSSSR